MSVLNETVANWRTISTALDIRYEYSIDHQILKDEHEWAIGVYRILQRKAESADALTACRLRRAIPKALEVLRNLSTTLRHRRSRFTEQSLLLLAM